MITVAIPYWESDRDKREVLYDCVSSLKGYDRLLVLSGRQPTLPLAWNMCLDMAFGMGTDYCILSNDDIILNKGLISDLCIPDKVVSPTVNGTVFKKFHAHIFSLPRSVYEKIGKFDESFQLYWADTDYCKRLVDAGVSVETSDKVDVLHPEPARTLKFFAGISANNDQETFVKKWGRTWFDPSMGK